MEPISNVNNGVKPVVMSSEELKALLYLTIRGGIRLPEIGQAEPSTTTENTHQVDVKA